MEWIDTLIGLVGGGVLVTLITLPSIIKKSNAEARASEIDNLHKVIEGWEKLADERQESNRELDEKIKANEQRIDELNRRIDTLYEDIGGWRDRCSALQEENTQLKIERATNEVKLCMVRGCASRQPQSGY